MLCRPTCFLVLSSWLYVRIVVDDMYFSFVCFWMISVFDSSTFPGCQTSFDIYDLLALFYCLFSFQSIPVDSLHNVSFSYMTEGVTCTVF